jgi:hypothetical protein
VFLPGSPGTSAAKQKASEAGDQHENACVVAVRFGGRLHSVVQGDANNQFLPIVAVVIQSVIHGMYESSR